MRLTISKKFELSLSSRYHNPDWSDEKNREIFGLKAGGNFGYGANMNLYAIFTGPVDRATGMLLNVATIKERMKPLLADRYDHKYLNLDTSPFDRINPTPENIAAQLLIDARPLFSGESADLTACHLTASPEDEATAYENHGIERHYWIEFSAARSTRSPRLSEENNQRLFGIAASPHGHGHHYRMRITLSGNPDSATGMIAPELEVHDILTSFKVSYDHKNLSLDCPEFKDIPMTTESLARYFFTTLRGRLPVVRIRLWENPWFYCEYLESGESIMGIETAFRAAHRLHSPRLDNKANLALYGKCNNPYGHGHRYRVELALAGAMTEDSGMLFPLDMVLDGLRTALADWDYKHLDIDTDDFRDRPSTGENIISVLWDKLSDSLQNPIYRLRLWETPNNRFTLRV